MLKYLLNLIAVFFFLLPAQSVFAGPDDFTVLGVIASTSNNQGVALVKNKKTDKVTAYREGSQLEPGLTIKAVGRKEIILSYRNETLRLAVGAESAIAERPDKSPSATFGSSHEGIELKENTLRVQASLKSHLVEKKLGEVLMQVASEPYVVDGRLLGFKLWDIEKGSIFEIAGFQDGDLITHINQQPLSTAALAIRILNQLRNASEADVNFVRNGSERTLKILIQ